MTPCSEHDTVKTTAKNAMALALLSVTLVIGAYVYASNSVNKTTEVVTRVQVEQGEMRADVRNIKDTMKTILDEVRKK